MIHYKIQYFYLFVETFRNICIKTLHIFILFYILTLTANNIVYIVNLTAAKILQEMYIIFHSKKILFVSLMVLKKSLNILFNHDGFHNY